MRYIFKILLFLCLFVSTCPYMHINLLLFLRRYSYIETIKTKKSLCLYWRAEKFGLKIAFSVKFFVFLSHLNFQCPYRHIPVMFFFDSLPPRVMLARKKIECLLRLIEIFHLKVPKNPVFHFRPEKVKAHKTHKIFCNVHQTIRINKISKNKQILRGSLTKILDFG